MATASAWAPTGPARFGLSQGPTHSAQTELTAVATPGTAGQSQGKVISTDNPLFWFGILGAATFGLMAFSTTVRVGPATASVGLGKA